MLCCKVWVDIVTPQVTRKIVHAMNVMNVFTGQGKRLITEITTPDFFLILKKLFEANSVP